MFKLLILYIQFKCFEAWDENGAFINDLNCLAYDWHTIVLLCIDLYDDIKWTDYMFTYKAAHTYFVLSVHIFILVIVY